MTGMIDRTELWIVILALGLGSFGLRFVFLGLVGDKAMPDWVLRHLRYTAVSVLPALVAPLVVWPGATGGEIDPPVDRRACGGGRGAGNRAHPGRDPLRLCGALRDVLADRLGAAGRWTRLAAYHGASRPTTISRFR